MLCSITPGPASAPARVAAVGADRTNADGLPRDDAELECSGDVAPTAVRLNRAAPISISDVPWRIATDMRAAGDTGEADRKSVV